MNAASSGNSIGEPMKPHHLEGLIPLFTVRLILYYVEFQEGDIKYLIWYHNDTKDAPGARFPNWYL